MNLKKPLLVAGIVSGVGLASVAGMGVVSAQSNPTPGTVGDSQSIVDKLATKFHLNKADVQAVFDQDKQEHDQVMQQRLEDRLSQAVKDGKITSGQKTEILNKLSEMRSFMESQKDKTPQERKTAMDQKRTELEQWAKDNNIPQQYLKPLGGHRPMMHMQVQDGDK